VQGARDALVQQVAGVPAAGKVAELHGKARGLLDLLQAQEPPPQAAAPAPAEQAAPAVDLGAFGKVLGGVQAKLDAASRKADEHAAALTGATGAAQAKLEQAGVRVEDAPGVAK
jgi:hypothetical protein